ncbi:MAG TPA: ferredoxin [Acidimicrobiales bacterium]
MRIVVNQDRCQGHAQCWSTAPELFELDDHGFASAASDTLDPADLARAEHAELGCPERAITIER